ASAFVVDDRAGSWHQAVGNRIEGEARLSEPGRARQLRERVDRSWERARQVNEYRGLGTRTARPGRAATGRRDARACRSPRRTAGRLQEAHATCQPPQSSPPQTVASLLKQFAQSSQLGANAAYLEDLYEQYLVDPDSVGPQWQAYFDGFQGREAGDVPHSA